MALGAAGAGAIPASAGAAAPIWQLQQPPPPPGAPFKVPLGPPGDMKFIAQNRGLLTIDGNGTISPGLYAWNGQTWHQLATVCGDAASTSRIAIAGPDEFWTISTPSPPRNGAGLSLCHFKDGQVVASYGTALQSPDPYRQMEAAACNGPSDCWFAGIGSQDPTGSRIGSFHLHWDGSSLTSSYYPQGRGISALVAVAGAFIESAFLGNGPGDTTGTVSLASPEDPPQLLHHIVGGQISNDPFTLTDGANPNSGPSGPSGPPGDPGLARDGELLALGSDGASNTWAVGGGAASGPNAPSGGVIPRPLIALRSVSTGWNEVPVVDPNPLDPAIAPTARFVSVSPVPGSTDAWMALQPYADQTNPTARAYAAHVLADGTTSVTRLPTSGAGRGSAARVLFTSPTDGWLVTSAGWLFHYTDGTAQPLDTDPNFAGVITFRPNESLAQFVPDRPPADDSQLFAPPPVQVITQTRQAPAKTIKLKPLLTRIKSHLHGFTLFLSFTLIRKAKVGLVATRRGHVVAKTPFRLLRPGHHTLKLRLSRRRYPDHLKFRISEPGVGTGGSPTNEGDNGTVST